MEVVETEKVKRAVRGSPASPGLRRALNWSIGMVCSSPSSLCFLSVAMGCARARPAVLLLWIGGNGAGCSGGGLGGVFEIAAAPLNSAGMAGLAFWSGGGTWLLAALPGVADIGPCWSVLACLEVSMVAALLRPPATTLGGCA